MQESQINVEFLPKSEVKAEDLSSMLLECPSADICQKCRSMKEKLEKEAALECSSALLCPHCKDIKSITKIQKQDAALDESEQEEDILRGTESTDTIVAFPQNSQADYQNFTFVSDVLNNMVAEIKSIESIHELKPKKDEKFSIKPIISGSSTALENALRSSDSKRLSYFDDEGFKRYDLTIVTSLTDLDTLKEKTDTESPRVSFTFKKSSMNLIESKRQSWRSLRKSSGSFLSRMSNAFRKSNQ